MFRTGNTLLNTPGWFMKLIPRSETLNGSLSPQVWWLTKPIPISQGVGGAVSSPALLHYGLQRFSELILYKKKVSGPLGPPNLRPLKFMDPISRSKKATQ